MHKIVFHLMDAKLSFAGIIFLGITISDVELGLKITASILMIGYTIRRWRHFEKNKTTKNSSDD
jgi:hypothetical protein